MTLPQFQLKDKSGTNYQPIVERFIGEEDTSRTLQWDTEYVALEDGFVSIEGVTYGDDNKIQLKIDGTPILWFGTNTTESTISVRGRYIIPIKKGQHFLANGGSAEMGLKFYKTA